MRRTVRKALQLRADFEHDTDSAFDHVNTPAHCFVSSPGLLPGSGRIQEVDRRSNAGRLAGVAEYPDLDALVSIGIEATPAPNGGSARDYLADSSRRQRSGHHGRPRHDSERALDIYAAIVSRQRAHLSGRCLCIADVSERVPAPRPESAGRTVGVAPGSGAADRFWGRGGGGLG